MFRYNYSFFIFIQRFIPGLEYTNLNDKKLYPEEIAHLLKAAGIKEQEIPAMVETIFEQNDWNRDNALDEVGEYSDMLQTLHKFFLTIWLRLHFCELLVVWRSWSVCIYISGTTWTLFGHLISSSLLSYAKCQIHSFLIIIF